MPLTVSEQSAGSVDVDTESISLSCKNVTLSRIGAHPKTGRERKKTSTAWLYNERRILFLKLAGHALLFRVLQVHYT